MHWWVELATSGFGGFILAVLIAAIAVLIAGNIVVWTVVGLKSIDRSFSVGFRRGTGRERPPD